MKEAKCQTRLLLYFCLFCFLNCSSSAKNDNSQPSGNTYHADDLPSGDTVNPAINILWDSTSARKISHDIYFTDYGRVHRIPNGDLILTYGSGPDASHTRTNVVVRRSTDNGLSWSPAITIMNGIGQAGYTGFANPELLVMQNGWLMLAFEGKGNPDDNEHDNVQIMISKDNGNTWGSPQIIAKGRSWEPGMLQLPDGDIELFYSSEAKWWPSSSPEQDILLVHSLDNGNTWSQPQQVAYNTGKRDGMPVPILLNNNKGIVFSIEGIGDSKSPYILWSSLDAKWNYSTLGSIANGRRWLATSENVFGGAPFIMQLKTGESLLSFEAADGRNTGGDFRKQVMLVYRGDNMARAQSFHRINDPWPNLPDDEGTYYSSLFLKNDTTIVLVTTRNRPDGHSEIWWKEGRLTINYPKSNWSIASFSSEEPNNNRLASMLIDGDINTFWIARYSSNPTFYPDHYITVDMGKKLNVDGFTVVQKTTDRKVKTLQILVGEDTIHWKDLGNFLVQNKNYEEQLLPLPTTQSFRYFKIVPKEGYDNMQQPGLAEIGTYRFKTAQ